MRIVVALMLLVPTLVAVPSVQASCEGQVEDTICLYGALQNNPCQAINVFCQTARLQSILGGYMERTCVRVLGPSFCYL